MVMHLLQQAVNKGVNLQTHTPVLSISPTTSPDNYYTLLTPRGPLLAKTVILATNAYTSSLAPQYTSKIIPCRGICTRITAPSSQTPPYLPTTHNIRYGPGLYDYQIPRPDGSIIVGGGRHTFMHDLKQWYNVTDDGTLIEPAMSHFEDGLMQKYYRGWEESGARLDQAWTGIMGVCCLVPNFPFPLSLRSMYRVTNVGIVYIRLDATYRCGARKAESIHLRWFQWPWYAPDLPRRKGHCEDDSRWMLVWRDWDPRGV